MKKFFTIFMMYLFSILFPSVANCEDLHLEYNLSKHFENKSRFNAWYKNLKQSDKNLVLAGTVVFCHPELTEIALANGGDIKTPVYHIYSPVSYGGVDTYLSAIFTNGNKEQADRMALNYNPNIFIQGIYSRKSKFPENNALLSNDFISLLTQGIAGCQLPEDKIKMTKLLLKNGADINTTNKYGENAFQFAIESIKCYDNEILAMTEGKESQLSKEEAIKQLFQILLENKPDEVSPEVQTGAVLYSISYGNEEITAMVKKSGFKANLNTSIAQSAIPDIICARDDTNNKLLQDLLNYGIRPQDDIIFSAIMCRNTEAVRVLLDKGVNANVERKSPTTETVRNGYFLQTKTVYEISSALSEAVYTSQADMAKLLLEHGAKSIMSNGKSAFEHCASHPSLSDEALCSLDEYGYKIYKKSREEMKKGGMEIL